MVMMVPPERFELIYPPIIKQHLKFIEAKYYSLIQESLENQLQFQPDIETRNRKPLRRPVVFGAKWEIRFGPDNRFCVFYRVDYDNEQVVLLAISEKRGNRLFIGGEEVEI
jgi:mRNA-degrading endonuclease RelE of RelBE toxin-antitoxin system